MTNKMEERYEGQFLDALDLPEGVEASVTIESITDPFTEKDSAKKVIKNAILAFKGKQKRLILNNTNYKNLKAMFGREPKDWVGKEVKIQRRYLEADKAFGVKNTMCVRIIPPIGTPILKSAASYMGSPTPYPEKGQRPAPQKAAPKPQPKPAVKDDSELSQWLSGVASLQTLENCKQWREQILSSCPEQILGQVEKALAEHEQALEEK